MTYSTNARRNLLATSADEPLLELIEITHPELDATIRIVNDTTPITVNGHEFIACPFTLSRPDDVDQQTPSANISVDNVSRDLTYWLERSNGGKGSKIRVMAVMRSSPDVLEFDMRMDLSGLSIDNLTVDGSLGFQNTLALPAVAKRFDPKTAPGMF